MGGVVKRSQQAHNVTKRRALNPTLADRNSRTSLKIDEHEVFAGVQHLVQVAIAVTVNPRSVDPLLDDHAKFGKDRGLPFEDR